MSIQHNMSFLEQKICEQKKPGINSLFISAPTGGPVGRRKEWGVDKREALFYKIRTRITRMATKKPVKPDIATEEKLDSILHPSTTAKTFKITLEFGHKISPNYEKAVDIARRNPTYREEGEGEWIRHSATYTPQEVEELFRLFMLIHEWESTEVLVNHKRIPFGHQLWLPLMWFHRVK